MSTNRIPEIVSKVSVTESENEEQPEETAASALTALGAIAAAAASVEDGWEPQTNDQQSARAEDGDENGEDFEIPQRYTKSGRKRAVPFPLKLMKVLSTKQFTDIITWMPSGKSFSIVQPKAFVADILPEHFKSAKYSSFTRKLHRWGFQRHYRGEEAGAFFHPDFQKDRLDLVEQMTCYKPEASAPKSVAAKSSNSPPPVPSLPASRNETPQTPMANLQQMPRMLSRSANLTPQQMPMPQPPQVMAQLRQQQQNLVRMPELEQAPSPPAAQRQQTTQMDAAERLHAAIEMEVTRRLKERLQAAALSRYMMHPSTPPANGGLHGPGLVAPTPMRPYLTPNSNDRNLLLQMHQQRKHKQDHFNLDPSCYGLSRFPRMANEGLEQLPRTNIAGARTA